jgi:hypothetical protein
MTPSGIEPMTEDTSTLKKKKSNRTTRRSEHGTIIKRILIVLDKKTKYIS